MPKFFHNQDITDWQVESDDYWQQKGKYLAWKNLASSVLTLVTAFMVWMFWSAFVVYLGKIDLGFSLSQLYWLTALPLISAGFFRLIYSFTVPIFGGRNWTVFATLIMAVPLIGCYFCLQYQLSYWLFALMALLTGVAGANFASSSANISFFFPHRIKSIALGLNASIGNIGVGIIQWCVPFLLATSLGSQLNLVDFTMGGQTVQPQIVPLFLLVLVMISTLIAWF